MIKLSSKIISSIVGIALAGGAITATAATAQPKSAVSSAAPVSSTVSSAVVSSAVPVSSAAAVSSQTEVSNVADAVSEINEAAKEGVSAVHKAAQDGVEAVKGQQQQQNENGKKALASVKYPVIDINNGCRLVDPDAADYQKCKAALSAYGNDAGTCSPENSKACQAAIAAYKAAHPVSQPSVK